MYLVSTIQRDNEGDIIAIKEIGSYQNKIKAMGAAKKLAKGAKDCWTYGPSSLAYYGDDELTAVVSWK